MLFFLSLQIHSQAWVPIGIGVNGYVNTLFVYDSVMYAGGSFTSPGNNIAQWNGSNWDSVSSGTNNEVYAFGKYKGLIYVGGWFSKAGGHSAGSIATWNGKSYANAGFDVEAGKYSAGIVDVICQYDSLLYIGGQFDSVDHKRPSGLVTWNGTKTDSLNTFYGGWWSNVSILTTCKNLLFIGFGPGYNGGQSVGTWNNKTDNGLGNDYFCTASSSVNLYMNAFCTVDSNLYLGGHFSYYYHNTFSQRDTVHNIAMWNGTTWTALGKGIQGTVNALVYYNNLLIAGGSFDSAGGIAVNNIAAWNGTSWSAIGNGVNGPVYALAIFDSVLYAGGDFSSPGNGIAKFDATYKITPTINIDSVNIFPNPNKGQFTVVCNKSLISNTSVSIEIYNILGEKILYSNLVNSNTNIDLVKQPAGIYIYKIYTSQGNLINPGKLIIE